ncbi:MAG: phosphatidate cytidylyltransferase [Pseudomonadota bacterium]
MLWQRVVTALALLPLILGAMFFLPNAWFAAFVAVPVLIAGHEWTRMAPVCRNTFMALLVAGMAGTFVVERLQPGAALPLLWISLAFWLLALVLVVRYPRANGWYRQRAFMYVAGLVLLVPAWHAVVLLQSFVIDVQGTALRGLALLGGFVVVWGADVGAYFAGRAFGRHKLAVHVSPGKSVEGAVGGLALTLLLAFALAQARALTGETTVLLLALVLVATLASILGDLFESMVKREAGMKDSGTLLPGHGGMLDRIDSVTCALPVFALGYVLLGIAV